MSRIRVRNFIPDDAPRLAEILIRNGQYSHPEIEGPEAMVRFGSSDSAIFLVAESAGKVVAFLRATYDGSRAMIHVLSVDPDAQRKGVGRALVGAAEAELDRRGAPGAAATVTESSFGFWRHMGYTSLPVHLMLKKKFDPGKGTP